MRRGIGDGAHAQKGNSIDIAHMGHAGRFHIHAKRSEFLANLRTALIGNKGFARRYRAKADGEWRNLTICLCQGQQLCVRREKTRWHPGVILREDIVRHIVIHHLPGNHGIKKLPIFRRAARRAHDENRADGKHIGQNLRRDRRVHLANPAVNRHHIHALQRAQVECQHSLSYGARRRDMRQQRRQFRVAGAKNAHSLRE